MDPEATWAIVNDEDADTDERDFAALDMLVWLARGGRAPFTAPPANALIYTIKACERRLTIGLGG